MFLIIISRPISLPCGIIEFSKMKRSYLKMLSQILRIIKFVTNNLYPFYMKLESDNRGRPAYCLRVCMSSVKCSVSGWLAEWESIAFGSWFTHAMTFAHFYPFSRAFSTPVDVPPAPQKRSIYKSVILLILHTPITRNKMSFSICKSYKYTILDCTKKFHITRYNPINFSFTNYFSRL